MYLICMIRKIFIKHYRVILKVACVYFVKCLSYMVIQQTQGKYEAGQQGRLRECQSQLQCSLTIKSKYIQ